MKKNYTTPNIEVILFNEKDIVVNLASSGEDHNTEIDYD